MSPVALSAVVVAMVAMLTGSARADERAVIDQVVLEPAALGGQRLRVFVSTTNLQGQVLDLADLAVKLVVNGSKLDAPVAIGTYGPTQSDTAIVVVLQVSSDLGDVLPTITEALDTNVLGEANERTQIGVLTYGESVGAGKLGSLRAARAKVPTIQSDGSVGEPSLLDSLERALVMLKKAATKPEGRPLRKMIVIVGDGRDASNDRDRVIRLGKRADKAGVRIHTMGFSPKDVRRPLLLLGELSKQSLGTFRWVRGAKSDSWTPAFQQLAAELNKQTVITAFPANDADLSGAKVKVEIANRAVTYLNEGKVPAVSCNGAACDAGQYCAADRCVAPKPLDKRGILGWIVIIGGAIVGLLVVLGVIGFVMTKRQALASQVGVQDVPANLHVHGVVPPQAPSRPPKTIAFSSQPPAPGAAMPTAGAARLYVISGPYAGRELPLKHGFFIGKAAGCDLLIEDGFTSGHHAQFVMDGNGRVTLFDYGSTNGTFVNGQKITSLVLEHNSTIKIGSTELRFLAQ
ncbi:MAG: FHA domain-containing protein [Deltaproteobacteria bacterium]|nr:FHA domain-containing protein [Deltaproteobacteria bacterium]